MTQPTCINAAGPVPYGKHDDDRRSWSTRANPEAARAAIVEDTSIREAANDLQHHDHIDIGR